MLWGLRRLMAYDCHIYYHALGKRLQEEDRELNAFVILGNLIQYDGCNQRELADYSRMRPSNLTGILRRYEKKGWLYREAGRRHRESLVYITDAGREEFAALMVIFDAMEEIMFADFTEEEKNQCEQFFLRIGNNIYNDEKEKGRFHLGGIRPGLRKEPII